MSPTNSDYVTKTEFYKAIETLQENLMSGIETMGETLEHKLEQKLEQKHAETRRHLGVMIEEAKARFLHTSHDQVSLNGDKIDQHEKRIKRLESVTGLV